MLRKILITLIIVTFLLRFILYIKNHNILNIKINRIILEESILDKRKSVAYFK